MEPFLKWPGGKRFIARRIASLINKRSYRRYIEPFAGGAAVFFAAQPRSAILADCNEELINLYRIVRDEPNELIRSLKRLDNSESAYYKMRMSRPRSPVGRAKRLYYLMRLSFNGIYRENLSGQFNVPYGWKTSFKVVDCDALVSASNALSGVAVASQDFRKTLRFARTGDIVYIDPPYTVRHNNNGFIKYNQRLFSWVDQIDLAAAVAEAMDRGADVIVSNADHSDIMALYDERLIKGTLSRVSIMAANPRARLKTTEALFVSPSLEEILGTS